MSGVCECGLCEFMCECMMQRSECVVCVSVMQERVWCVCVCVWIVKEWRVYMVFEREVWCGSDMAKDVLTYLSYALFGVCLLCCGGGLGGPVMAPPALICWMLQSRRSSDDNVIRLDHSHHAPCTLTSLLVS